MHLHKFRFTLEQNLLRFDLVLLRNGPDHLAGHTGGNDPRRDVMGHHASRTDDRTGTDGHAPQTVAFAPIQTFSSSVIGAEVPMPWLRCSGSMA